MTALALAYSPVLGKFAIAADGLSASEIAPIIIDTEQAQKIFPFQHKHDSIALAFAGLGRTRTNSFNLVTESTKQMDTLIKRPFQNGYELAYKFRFNMIKALEKALGDGRIAAFTVHSESANRTLVVIFYIFGYFKQEPFWVTTEIFYNLSDHTFSVEPTEPNLKEFQFVSTGSYPIGQMFYNQIPFDPRLADRKYLVSETSVPLEAVHKFVETCALPIAREVDPWCRGIGGHVHAAELSASGFQWAIEPKRSATHQ
jgi:hypothetical protein